MKNKKRPRPPSKSGIQTQISDRKAKRKGERDAKKKKKRSRITNDENDGRYDLREISTRKTSSESSISRVDNDARNKLKKKEEKKSKQKKKDKGKNDVYDILDENTKAALRNDDEEIAMLEKNLGLRKGGGKDRKKLNKEYAKLEGYGDDFGDFLDGLDGILDNLAGGPDDSDDLEHGSEMNSDSDDELDYDAFKAKQMLRKELQIDLSASESEEDDQSERSEEIVPMKENFSEDENEFDDQSTSSSTSDNDSATQGETKELEKENNRNDSIDESSEESDQSDDDQDSDSDSRVEERDHKDEDTYHPLVGQDLYGNIVDKDLANQQKPTKYVPPHLRNKQNNQSGQSTKLDDDNDPERKEKLRIIQRKLNNNLNRLADNTLESVAKSMSSIYSSNEYSVRDTNECLWKNMKMACVVEHMVMSGLIPIYIACVSGVHYQIGDVVQLGGDIIERAILSLWDELKKFRDNATSSTGSSSTTEHISKEASNYMLIICYLYNYSVVHCTLIYDLVLNFIQHFTELDVELLLLILSHCGQQLRSDDPTALKDIVILVQERSLQVMNESKKKNEVDSSSSSSRAQFMVTAITDFKNNKRQQKDIIIAEKSAHFRRVIGRMKSAVSSNRSVDTNNLRVTIQDILDIETKGRWWKVGAKWAGHDEIKDSTTHDIVDTRPNESKSKSSSSSAVDKKQQKLLKLAIKQRMNTDLRRSIFCIIMGSDDCQDAFENLVHSAMLKGKNEREVVRVIVHCCGQEKVYNPYYTHLANRICEYQPKCKFTFQLAFWDCFKQFDDMKARKAANLAKLLAHLMMNYKLNLNVLKVIEVSPDDDMSEASIIFLTILFTNIFESLEDSDQVVALLKRGEVTPEQLSKMAEAKAAKNGGFDDDDDDDDKDDLFAGNNREALKENISVFLLHYLQSSPKNKKNSTFRTNLKAAIKSCENDGFDLMM